MRTVSFVSEQNRSLAKLRTCHFHNIIFTVHQGHRELTEKDYGMDENMSPLP